MKSGFTRDPHVALSGLVAMALVGVLAIAGGSAVVGVMERSWIQTTAGAVSLVVLGWMVLQAGQVVRRALRGGREPTGRST